MDNIPTAQICCYDKCICCAYFGKKQHSKQFCQCRGNLLQRQPI